MNPIDIQLELTHRANRGVLPNGTLNVCYEEKKILYY